MTATPGTVVRRVGWLAPALFIAACSDQLVQPEVDVSVSQPAFGVLDGYDFEIVDINPPGGSFGTAFAVNDLGEAVVAVSGLTDSWWLYHDGGWTPLSSLTGKPFVLPFDLSDDGLLVGQWEPIPFQRSGFALDVHTGEFHDLGNLGRGGTAQAVNADHTMVGYGHGSDFVEHAIIWTDESSSPEILPGLTGSTQCQARDINNDGVAVGFCRVGRMWPVAWVDRRPVLLQTSGPFDILASGVNNHGEIAGWNRTSGEVYIWPESDASPVRIAGVHPNAVVGITDAGWVGGYRSGSTGIESFLIIDAETHVLPSLYVPSTSMWDVSNTGPLAGRTSTSAGSHAVLWYVTPHDPTPEEILEELQNQVADVERRLGRATVGGLAPKLDVAAAALARDDDGAAVNQLDAFLSELDALFRSRRLGESYWSAWTELVTEAIDKIENPEG